MSYAEQSDKIAGTRALLKQYVTGTGRGTAVDAAHDGRSDTRSGMGKLIENFHRTSPYNAILGGVDDVMGDLECAAGS